MDEDDEDQTDDEDKENEDESEGSLKSSSSNFVSTSASESQISEKEEANTSKIVTIKVTKKPKKRTCHEIESDLADSMPIRSQHQASVLSYAINEESSSIKIEKQLKLEMMNNTDSSDFEPKAKQIRIVEKSTQEECIVID